MQAAEQYCQRIVQGAGSNFAAAFRFLDRPQRRAMRALYAFCRVVDDVVDSDFDAAAKREQIAAWRDHLAPAVWAQSDHPLLVELRESVAAFDIPMQYLRDLVDGVARDIAPAPYPDWAALEQYCYGVAGTVGLSCLRIFRVPESETTRTAGLALANAFQLTNILRDVRSDGAIGRVYLPESELRACGVTAAELCAASTPAADDPRLRMLITRGGERAEAYFADAWRGFPRTEAERLRSALLMSDYYYAILQRIRAHPERVWTRRVRLTTGTKLWLFLRRSFSAAAWPASPPLSN
ncbi:MAG: phytoene/squalene synthase family protein [Deltaproteobacteria bacterium]|nr:phytoene/squalene synthase family protein [Deltaproteobacteria bacterium]